MINTYMKKYPRGVTLIELMISMAISLILLLGVISIYVTSKHSYVVQDGMARQQENGRFAVEMLTRDLRMAGFPKDNHLAAFVVASTADGGSTAADTITIQYESDTDCLGQPTPANSCGTNACAINRYSIDANNNLICLGNGGVASDVIAEGITNMQILYGIDTDSSPDGIANKYNTWANVTVAERDKIVSVRFGLLARTPAAVKKAASTTSHTLLDQTVAVNTQNIHRAYSSTVVLRNQL